MYSTEPTPYDFVPIEHQSEDKEKPIGHSRLDSQKIHGRLSLLLKVKTPVHISTGVLALGEDLDVDSTLVQPMTGRVMSLLIPGSSFKGAIRSVYEAITRSPLGASNDKKLKLPKNSPLKADNNKKRLSPAGRVFGAMGYQGLLRFTDAICNAPSEIGFMPVLYEPGGKSDVHYFDEEERPVGRKFYYHTQSIASKRDFNGVDIQQAPAGSVFTTHLQFKNLSEAELGTLLIALGQATASDSSDEDFSFALKLGGGKPMGFGTVEVQLSAIHLHTVKTLYAAFNSPLEIPENIEMWKQDLIRAARKTLVVEAQLKRLSEILNYPTNRQPPKGNY